MIVIKDILVQLIRIVWQHVRPVVGKHIEMMPVEKLPGL